MTSMTMTDAIYNALVLVSHSLQAVICCAVVHWTGTAMESYAIFSDFFMSPWLHISLVKKQCNGLSIPWSNVFSFIFKAKILCKPSREISEEPIKYHV